MSRGPRRITLMSIWVPLLCPWWNWQQTVTRSPFSFKTSLILALYTVQSKDEHWVTGFDQRTRWVGVPWVLHPFGFIQPIYRDYRCFISYSLFLERLFHCKLDSELLLLPHSRSLSRKSRFTSHSFNSE